MCNDLAFSFDLLGNDCWLPFTTRFMPVLLLLLLFPFQGTMAVRCGVWVLTYIRTYIRCWAAFIAMWYTWRMALCRVNFICLGQWLAGLFFFSLKCFVVHANVYCNNLWLWYGLWVVGLLNKKNVVICLILNWLDHNWVKRGGRFESWRHYPSNWMDNQSISHHLDVRCNSGYISKKWNPQSKFLLYWSNLGYLGAWSPSKEIHVLAFKKLLRFLRGFF